MTEHVPMLTVAFLAVSCLIAIATPIALAIWYRKKKGADVLPFFIGCAVFVLFALALESGMHRLILGSPAGDAIRGSLWLTALYGGLMAGLFEETGRLTAFSLVLRRKRGNDANALMYGAGHGGIEAIALVGLTYVNYIAYAVTINAGDADVLMSQVSGDALEQIKTVIALLTGTPSGTFLLAGAERLSAIVLHIALSVLVWFAVKKKERRYLYPAAILIHALVDALTVVFSGLGVPTLALELIIAAMSAASALLAWRVWKRERAAAPAGGENEEKP